MERYYKITDFTIVNDEIETDLTGQMVVISLNNISKLSDSICKRTEKLLNKTILEYQTETKTVLEMKEYLLRIYIEADTIKGQLALKVCIFNSFDNRWITGKQIVARDNCDYGDFRKYFLIEIMGVAIKQAQRIQKSI